MKHLYLKHLTLLLFFLFIAKLSSAQNIKLVAPVGGEVYTGCSNVTIKWSVPSYVIKVILYYSIDGGITWIYITDSYTYVDNYLWKVPNISSNKIRIKITDTYASETDITQKNFSIIQDAFAVLTLISPNGGERFSAGSIQTIRWNSSGAIKNVGINYSLDGGLTWFKATDIHGNSYDSVPNTGSFDWVVPNGPPSYYGLIRVSAASNSCVLDYNNAFYQTDQTPLITVINPVNNARLYVGDNFYIEHRLTNVPTENVNTDYSIDNGVTWIKLDSNSTNDFSWTVPNTLTNQGKLRIRSTQDLSIQTIVDFKIANPFLNLINPIGGTSFTGCTAIPVKWTQSDKYSTKKFDYSINGGTTWIHEADVTTTVDTVTYNWIVPNTPTTALAIRISDPDNLVKDSTKTNLTILKNTAALVINSPNGNESYTRSSWQKITWTTTGTVDYVNIEYSTDGGSSWRLADGRGDMVAFSVINTGSYDWFIPTTAIVSSKCLVRVYEIDKTCVSDISDNFFSINNDPSIVIKKPFEKDTLYVGDAYAIQGYASGLPDPSINVEYSLDNGNSWTMLDSNINVNSDFYQTNWMIPNVLTNQGILKVSALKNPSIQTRIHFEILAPFIKLLNLTGGDSVKGCADTRIDWIYQGIHQQASLYYSIDEGNNWFYTDVMQPTRGMNHYFWHVPNTGSNTVRILIKDYDPSVKDSSHTNFTIVPKDGSTIRIIYPNGGESFSAGSIVPVKWANGGPSTYALFSTDGGITYESMSDEHGVPVYGPTGGNWLIPTNAKSSSRCFIKIYNYGSDCSDVDFTDKTFTITDEPSISIINPVNNDTLYEGRTYPVKWIEYKRNTAAVNIEYSIDNGATWTFLDSNYVDSTHTYNWKVPNQLTSQGKLRITGTLDDSVTHTIRFNTKKPFIKLKNLIGGEQLVSCQSTYINWADEGTTEIYELSYSTDQGATWKYINGYFAPNFHEKSYPWQVPNITSANVRVRIRDVNNIVPGDSSLANSSIYGSQKDTLKISSPNGGEIFSANSSHIISWSSSGTIKLVNIEYSLTGGRTWQFVLDTAGTTMFAQPNTGSCNWVIPADVKPSATCLVRVHGFNEDCVSDESDAYFNVNNQANISLVSPIDKELLYVNQHYQIKWLYFNLPDDSVKIEYSFDNGTAWTTLIANYPVANKHIAWKLPNQLVGHGILKISSLTTPGIFDQRNFTISSQSIVLLSPSGGEALKSCETTPLSWINNGPFGAVKIDLSPDAGHTWIQLDSIAQKPGTNTISWPVPGIAGTTIRLRIRDAHNELARDSIKTNFSIVIESGKKYVTLLQPGGGELLEPGSFQSINWDSDNFVTYVDLFYSINNGESWSVVSSFGVPALNIFNQHAYGWQMPDLKGSYPNCLIKVRDSYDNCAVGISKSFSIDTTPQIKITLPVDSSTLYCGRAISIDWRYANLSSEFFDVDYSIDNGTTWDTVAKHIKNQGLMWECPNTLTEKGLIRVKSISKPSVFALSHFRTEAPSIALISPAGGEIYNSCASKTITWIQKGFSYYTKLESSFDNGKNWDLVEYITGKNGQNTYGWSVPNVASDQTLLRLSDGMNSAIKDATKSTFTIVADTNVRFNFISPAGNELFPTGSLERIQWTSNGFLSNVSLQYSIDNSTWYFMQDAFGNLSKNISNTGTFNWLIPNNPGTIKIKLFDANKGCLFVESDTFKIISKPTIAIIQPANNVLLNVGKLYQIKYVATNTSTTNADVDYSIDNGTTWVKIDSSSSGFSLYWTIPNSLTNNGLLRVRSIPDKSIQDIIHFKIITPTITLVKPLGGQTFTGCSTTKIEWASVDSLSYMNLQYSLDGGSNWICIACRLNTNGNKTYDWSVPNSSSNNVKVRVSDYFNPAASDSSTSAFSIAADTSSGFIVNSPNGGESYPVGTLHLIDWTTKGISKKVNVEYSMDGGKSWSFIEDALGNKATNVDNVGSYYWLISPYLPLSSMCLIRITNANNSCEVDYCDVFFSLNHDPAIAITNPLPNEVRYAGMRYPIEWSKTNVISDSVLLDYSTDDGKSWTFINTTVKTTYQWDVPNVISNISIIRARSKMFNSVEGLVKFKIQQSNGIATNETTSCKVYPNPVTDQLYWEIQDMETIVLKIQLLTVEGKIVYAEVPSKNKATFKGTIDVASEKAGVYILQIVTNNGIYTRKVIKGLN